MVIIGRHINGITLNAIEYLLSDHCEPLVFSNEDAAEFFLRDLGYTDEDICWMVFITID